MARKFPQFLLILILLSLAAAPAQAQSETGLVAVRIPVETGARAVQSELKAERVIDYGSFLWAVVDLKDLGEITASGEGIQVFENPYVLTLGGQSFDPLAGEPVFGPAWEGGNRGSGEPGIHLVQFHGPTKDAWLADLRAAGLDVIQYIHPFTYVVWGDRNALDRGRSADAVRWAGDFLPAYAVAPQNQTLSSDPILVRALVIPQAGLDAVVSAIQALGGELQGTASGVDPAFDLASFLLPGDQMLAAASLPGVYSIQPQSLEATNRSEMSNQINAGNYDAGNNAFPGYLAWLSKIGLTGAGVIIANVDSGIDQSHPDLSNRMVPCSGSSCGGADHSPHGTHTAGIMAGDASSGSMDTYGFLLGLGMAPEANLVEQMYSKVLSDPDRMLTLMTQSYLNGAVISGNSWGFSMEPPAGYDHDTRMVDIGVRDANPNQSGNQSLPYILSIDNGYGGTSSQGTPDEAKNAFTIGSTYMRDDTGAQLPNINDLSDNTAHGPALDGRTIPHLVAPGKYIVSTYPDGAYALLPGTSMASPHVSGAVALFVEKYRRSYGGNPSPALVKAAFLPVAHDLDGNLDADGGTLGHPFDSKQGWGRLNAAAVLDPDPDLMVIYFDQRTILGNTGETWSFSFTSPETIETLRAMLVWTDAPGQGLGGYTAAWVNDLDLTLTVGATTYRGNNFGVDGLSASGGTADSMNNTEGIFLGNQPATTYTFTVTASNIAGDGVPNLGDDTDQDFALVIYLDRDAFPIVARFPLFFH